MKERQVTTRSGESITLFQADGGFWCCPVCGSPEFNEPPYLDNGAPSYEMCSCGFEFGFDDDPGASKDSVDGVVNNWERWRSKIIQVTEISSIGNDQLRANLRNIGVEI